MIKFELPKCRLPHCRTAQFKNYRFFRRYKKQLIRLQNFKNCLDNTFFFLRINKHWEFHIAVCQLILCN